MKLELFSLFFQVKCDTFDFEINLHVYKKYKNNTRHKNNVHISHKNHKSIQINGKGHETAWIHLIKYLHIACMASNYANL